MSNNELSESAKRVASAAHEYTQAQVVVKNGELDDYSRIFNAFIAGASCGIDACNQIKDEVFNAISE